jgi:hypothetical protein
MTSRIVCAIAVIGVLASNPIAARADVVLQWNEIASTTLTTQVAPFGPLNPFAQARFSAIVQLAVFEAVNAITGDYKPYLGSTVAPGSPIVAPTGASPEAAAIAAAHAVLWNYIVPSRAALDAQRDLSLAAIPNSQAKTDGIGVGLAAAAALIAQRVGDGAAPAVFFMPAYPLDPGEWDITPACPRDLSGNFLGGTLLNWRDVTPFGVVRPASGHWVGSFLPAAPPDLTSNEYAKDYNEVKAVGGVTSAVRTDAEALVARFYAAGSPTYLFHMVARQLAVARGDSLSENARNLALISIATNDSLIASFYTKYHYNFWRPSTAIRAGSTDGNDKTVQDGTFATLLPTPCFPSYPSNHASGSNGAAETLRRIYGAAGHKITLSGPVVLPGNPAPVTVTYQYTSLEQITDDVDEARIWGGMHYRFDQVAGVRLGREVATFVYKNNLQPVHGSN